MSNADPGVATWVKGDMYIGSKPSNTANLNGANAPVGSYAVEAEGLTLVNGKLAMNPLKESWGGNGFRFGIVGFGAQFRPTPGSTALAVNGDESASAIDSMTTGGVTGDVGAWTHGAFTEGYGAKLSGNATNWETNARHKSVVHTKTDWDSSNSISWNQTNVLDNVNGKDYSDFGTYVNNLSNTLSLQQANGTVTYDTAPADSNYVRYKYNANSSNISYGFKFDASGKRSEKRITFTGDGTSALQVFKLKTSELQYIQSDDGTYQTNKNNPDDVNRGIVFDFENIPDNASVVVNVGGINDDGSGGSNVSFNNGWRFWWNGVEIGGGYSDKASTEQQRLYGVASQKVLWNFYDANVSIRGGIALEGNDAGGDGKVSYDDPSAAMLGSIVVRTGDFDDHVTTNGRVYVNGDFMMNNPTAARNTRFNEGATASVIDMDQERHNFPWNGQASSECSTISWQKVSSDDTTQLLPGSEWGIYTAQEDAQNATNALLIITDKSNNYGSGAGVFQTQNLAPNATYYLKELKAPDGYVKSDTIFTVVTSHTGDATNTVSVGAAGVVEDGKIANTPEGGSFSWSKAADDTNTLLDGSSWTLMNVATKESWIVDDSSTKVARVDIQDVRGSAIEETVIEQYSTVQLKAQVFADDNSAISQDVTWKSSDGSVASVSSDGLVTAIGSGSTVISACSVASRNTVCDTVLVTVNAKPANSLTVSRQGDTQAWSGTLELNTGDSADFTAVVEPSDIAVSWVSANTDIATVNASGHIVGVAEGQTTITAIAGDKQVSVPVVVSDTRFTTVYFKGDTLRAWMADSHISGAFSAADVVVRYSATNSGRDAWKQWPQSASLQEFCSDEWYSVKVPTEQKHMNIVLYNGQDVNNKSNYYMGSNGTTPFIVDAGAKNYTITDYQTYGEGVPTCSTSTARVAAYRMAGNQSYAQANENAARRLGTAASDSRTAASMTSSAAFISSVSSESNGIGTVQLISEKAMAGVAGCDADGHLCDNDSRLGIISVSKMADGTYILKEKEPPSGYTISQYVYRVVITSGKVVEWGWGESDDGPFKQCADDGTSICRTVTVSEEVGIIGRIYNQPTTAQWRKTDSITALALAGSSWRIANAGDGNTVAGSNVWCVRDNADSGSAVNNCNAKGNGTILADADPAEGSIGVRSLPAGDYTLTEADAPLGYVLDGTTYTLTVGVDGSSEVKRTDDSSPVTDSTIANDESRGSATWKKVDAQNTGKVLGGSSWTVRYTRTIGSQTVNKVYVVSDNESSDAGKPYACTPSEPDADHAEGVLCDTNARAGYFLIDNLEWGTYTLEERSAPQGYELNDKDKPSKSIGVIDGTFQRDIDLGTIADSQKNYFLPNTGRWGGVVTFVILGLIALLAGAAVVQRNRLPQSPQQLQ